MEIGETTAKDAVTVEGKVAFKEEAVVMLPLADPARSVACLEHACKMNSGEE